MNAMTLRNRWILAAAATLIGLGATPAFAQPDEAAEVQQADKLLESGDVDGTVNLLQKIVTRSPKSFDVRLALGRALDLQGRHSQARVHLEEALKLAKDDQRNTALTSLGVSYAFESKPDEAARYYQRAFDAEIQANDRGGAAGLANALGRIYLESGNLKKAEEWYTTGYETARKVPGLTPAQSALWEMRRHNAFGRIAARRGNGAAAGEHAAAAKALLDKGGNDNQAPFYPYLLGYIAFYGKNYQQAVDDLLKGDQEDPFVLGLIAQSYDRLRQRESAVEYSRKVMALPTHSINSAFARPIARKYLR
jgi:tetratricopeptide (TPR) repeat protein